MTLDSLNLCSAVKDLTFPVFFSRWYQAVQSPAPQCLPTDTYHFCYFT